jgi:hypothetical protein
MARNFGRDQRQVFLRSFGIFKASEVRLFVVMDSWREDQITVRHLVAIAIRLVLIDPAQDAIGPVPAI